MICVTCGVDQTYYGEGLNSDNECLLCEKGRGLGFGNFD